MGRHSAAEGASADPIVAEALARRNGVGGEDSGADVPPAADESRVGWPGTPAPEGGRQGWPADARGGAA